MSASTECIAFHSDRCLVEHIVSLATGHQRSERRSGVRTDYIQDRSKKLKEQRDELLPEASVLNNVRVYINGYLSDTTDIEMKRIVTQAGGQVVLVQCTRNLKLNRIAPAIP